MNALVDWHAKIGFLPGAEASTNPPSLVATLEAFQKAERGI